MTGSLALAELGVTSKQTDVDRAWRDPKGQRCTCKGYTSVGTPVKICVYTWVHTHVEEVDFPLCSLGAVRSVDRACL